MAGRTPIGTHEIGCGDAQIPDQENGDHHESAHAVPIHGARSVDPLPGSEFVPSTRSKSLHRAMQSAGSSDTTRHETHRSDSRIAEGMGEIISEPLQSVFRAKALTTVHEKGRESLLDGGWRSHR